MAAVRDKSRAAADQMNAAAKNAEQAIRCVIHICFLKRYVHVERFYFSCNMYPGRRKRTESRAKSV